MILPKVAPLRKDIYSSELITCARDSIELTHSQHQQPAAWHLLPCDSAVPFYNLYTALSGLKEGGATHGFIYTTPVDVVCVC